MGVVTWGRGKAWASGGRVTGIEGVRAFWGMMAFERLEAWRQAHELAVEVYQATAGWPPREVYGLVSQMRRAAISIPSNIAEGAAKRGPKELGRHLDIALGSFAELTYLLRLSLDLGFLGSDQWTALDARRARTGKLLWGLYRRARPKPAARSPS